MQVFGVEVRVQIRPASPAVETKEPPCHAASDCKSVQVIVMQHTFNSGTVLPSTHRHWMMVPLAHAEARVAHACHQASSKNGSQVSSYRRIQAKVYTLYNPIQAQLETFSVNCSGQLCTYKKYIHLNRLGPKVPPKSSVTWYFALAKHLDSFQCRLYALSPNSYP